MPLNAQVKHTHRDSKRKKTCIGRNPKRGNKSLRRKRSYRGQGWPK